MTGRWRWRAPLALSALCTVLLVLAVPADAAIQAAASSAPSARPAPGGLGTQPAAGAPARATGGSLEVHFIDVGQGNATLVVAPSGKTMLIDSGESFAAAKVAQYLDAVLGRRSIDYFVVSHYHADHFGSFVPLLRDYGVIVTTATYDRGGDRNEYNSSLYRNYFDYCTYQDPAGCKRTTILEGQTIDMGPGATATVICAGDVVIRVSCGETVRSENDNSILIVVNSDRFWAWVGGDTSGDVSHRYYADVETATVNLGRIGPYLDVYGVDHHGSCYSTNANLVNATWPTVSVFSLGRNTYGHPCQAVLDRLVWSSIYQTEDPSGGVVDGDVRIDYAGGPTYTVTAWWGPITFNTKT